VPHKLLIEFDIDFESPLRRLLKPGEVIRNEPVKLTFFVTNLGTERFPGGSIQNWHILFGPERDVVHPSPTANITCGEIAPGERAKLLSEEIVPLTEGLAWINLSIQPESEDKTVEYYQSPEDAVGGKEWLNCFYVVSREMLRLTSQIEELTRRLQP